MLNDFSATMTTVLAILGDRLGLFKALAGRGSTTAAELAACTGLNERYVREWMGGMAAQENGPFFFGGAHQMLPGLVGQLDQVARAFREGGGVKQSNYDPSFWDGLERFTGGWYEHQLVQEWIPAMPDVKAKLETGARVADVGCGRGRALIRLAQAFPKSGFVGYDSFGPTIALATEKARQAGIDARVAFQELDGAKGLPESFDVIATFEVVHDSVDPLGLLKAIRQALRPGGIYVCLDVNCSEKLEENNGVLGAMFHGFSVTYCMTTSLAWGGAGLGTVGFHEAKVREVAAAAGFAGVRRVPVQNPFVSLYEITT